MRRSDGSDEGGAVPPSSLLPAAAGGGLAWAKPMQKSDGHPRERSSLCVLAPDVVERIAAGEVIERPASVVKELLENALDAGAGEIRIEVRGGGVHLVRVIDDGDGIPANELEQVCVRHTTSKIRAFEDLSQLRSLGFRGEALASIATVSEVSIVSCAVESEGAPGHCMVWRGGEVLQCSRRARPHGTTVSVTDLFYNVPARLNYTHSRLRTENGYIVQLVRRYAIGYPVVRFSLTIDEHSELQTCGSGEVARVLTELYNLSLAEMLYPVAVSDEFHYRLYGYVGNRVLAQGNRQYMMLFVNGRWVQSRVLLEAMEQGYRSLLPKGKHPLLVLALELPPEEVDVNVHPAKTEVHLLHEQVVVAAMREAVKTVFERSPALPGEVQFPGPVLASQRRLPGPRRRGLHVSESVEGYQAEVAEPGSGVVIANLRPLAQLQQALVLAEAPDGSLYLVDQHRAHERVIYEHLRKTTVGVKGDLVSAGGQADAHLLLEPVLVEMKRYQAEVLEQRLLVLRNLGLECERFGGRSFLVRSVPAGDGQEQLAAYVQEFVEVAAEDAVDWQDQLLVRLACRSALRRGRDLGKGEQRFW
jgi:DNA mismatch repair protein MutL